jgi:hypothetical protein
MFESSGSRFSLVDSSAAHLVFDSFQLSNFSLRLLPNRLESPTAFHYGDPNAVDILVDFRLQL